MSDPVYQLDIGPSGKHGIVTRTNLGHTTEIGTVQAESRPELIRAATELAREHRDPGEPRLVTLDLDAPDDRALTDAVVRYALEHTTRSPASLVGS